MSRLISTTVDSQVSRVYQYSQDGKLLSADVDGLLTTFAYDGDGNRLLMSVAGEVTTYTLDYGNGKQILLEQGGAFAQTKHYLYGLSCIGELVDADDPETEEWRYYQRDGRNLVRQTTNSAAEITLAWAYSPDGAVLIGAKGPVTNLGCGDIYDWSTGLVYKNGRYFDPNLGIWLTLAPYVVWQKYKLGKRGGKSRRKRRDRKQLFLLLLFLLVIALALAGCIPNPPDPTPGPTPTPTPCPTPDPTRTPTPTQPPGLPPNTPTPIPTITPRPPTETPWPSPTPSPTPRPDLDLLSFPYPFKLSNPFGDKEIQVVQPFGVNWGGADAAGRSPLGGGQANGASLHNGIDLISGGDALHWRRGTTPPQNTRDVYAPVTGAVESKRGSTVRIQQIEYNGRTIEGLEVRLTHLNIDGVAAQMNAGSGPITEYGNYGTTLPHLHISVILYYENFSQGRISRNYAGEAVYYDPRPLLQEYGPIDYDYSQ